MEKKERVQITVSCKDCEYIPKVDHAGDIITPLGKGKSYQIMHNGIKVFTDSHYGEFMTEIITHLRGHHEPQEEKIFHEVLKVIPQKGVMLELGSFWAYYSMWFNKCIKNAQNYMIEPIEKVMLQGVANFELNGLRGDFTQASIGKESKEHIKFQHWDGVFYDISQVTVDDFLKKKGLNYVDILHADIQGVEYDMLMGAQNSLSAGRIGFIIISTHSEELHRQCLQFLLARNYKIIAEHSLSESYSVDGLISVCHKDKGFAKISISKRKLSFLRLFYSKIAKAYRSIIN
jgi:FkbM family methyltransferase